MKKKINFVIIIIVALAIILGLMLFFYFKGESNYSEYYNYFDSNTTQNTESETTISINASSQVSSALTENIRLHATYYFQKLLVSKNQIIKKGTKIIQYTNGKYLVAPYDLVITDYKLPSSKKICTTSHYIKVSSVNVLSTSFRVSEEKISAVSLGQKVKVKIPALNDRELDGYVTNITNTAENGRFTVTVEFDNDGDIRIGMSVSVSI